MTLNSLIRVVATACLLSSGTAATARDLPEPFSADILMRGDGHEQTGRMFADGKRTRTEMSMANRTMVSIADPELGKVWLILPGMGCMEQEFDPEQNRAANLQNRDYDEEFLGKETVDGHPTKKYRIKVAKDQSMLQWRATDLGEVPIKTAYESGRFEILLQNVQLGAPNESLMARPDNCMSGFPGMPDPGKP